MGHSFARSLLLSGDLLRGPWPVGPQSYPFRFGRHSLMFSSLPRLRGLREEAKEEKNASGLAASPLSGLALGHLASLGWLRLWSELFLPWERFISPVLTQPDQALGCPGLSNPAVSLDRPSAVCLKY